MSRTISGIIEYRSDQNSYIYITTPGQPCAVFGRCLRCWDLNVSVEIMVAERGALVLSHSLLRRAPMHPVTWPWGPWQGQESVGVVVVQRDDSAHG